MKTRLNFFCLIAVLVLGYSVLRMSYYFSMGVKAGVEAAVDDTAKEELNRLSNMKYVSLLPDGFSLQRGQSLFRDSVYNELSRSYVPVAYSGLAVSVETHPSAWECFFSKLLVFLQLGMYLWAIVLFVRLIVSINKSDIFNWRNVRRLHRLGIALLLGFFCMAAQAYLTYASLCDVFALQGYELEFSDVADSKIPVLGLCALIVGEVFAIGLKIKEEQDLTI